MWDCEAVHVAYVYSGKGECGTVIMCQQLSSWLGAYKCFELIWVQQNCNTVDRRVLHQVWWFQSVLLHAYTHKHTHMHTRLFHRLTGTKPVTTNLLMKNVYRECVTSSPRVARWRRPSPSPNQSPPRNPP